MKLRKLEIKDAELMLEWMHDPTVVGDLKTDFTKKTLDDCIHFIQEANKISDNLHLAIVDNNDEYMGTVSLKNIVNRTAEFGIAIRKIAMGKGFSKFGMESILDLGFNKYDLEMIYWCVDPVNIRAVRFYDKNGYQKDKCPKEAKGYTSDEIREYIWYTIKK